MFKQFLDFFLHIDRNLVTVVDQYGGLSYGILGVVIFMETGLVVTPFLPGDSLIFAAGALAAVEVLKIGWLYGLLLLAAVVGDTVNYEIGRYIGPKAFGSKSRLLKKEYLEKAQSFYEKHGGKAITLARFVPIVRTFAPFVAGVGKMNYGHFLIYNFLGGFLWVSLFLGFGYFFGTLPVVKDNFHYVVVAIVLLSVIPMIWEWIKSRKENKKGDGR